MCRKGTTFVYGYWRCFLISLALLVLVLGCNNEGSPPGEDEDTASDTATEIDTEPFTDTALTDCDGQDDFDAAHCANLQMSDESDCVFYVDAQNQYGGDGLTWAGAFQRIQPAVDAAYCHARELGSCQVWVGQGEYYIYQECAYDSLRLRPGVSLYGGFRGDEQELQGRDHEAYPTVLNGAAGPDDETAVFHVVTGSDDSLIDGFTITGGKTSTNAWDTRHLVGAGMMVWEASPTVANCVFSQNSASHKGSAIFVYKGDVLIQNSEFDNNETLFGHGGAIYGFESKLSIENSSFDQNSSGHMAGAVHLDQGSLVARGTLFHKNSASHMGGAIAVVGGSAVFENCQFLENSSVSYGGAVYLLGVDIVVERCNWGNNRSGKSGGAIVCSVGGSCLITNTTFFGNAAKLSGGALYIRDDVQTTVLNSSFTGNTADESGGAMDVAFSLENSPEVFNSILWENQPSEVSTDKQGAVNIVYSNIQGGYAGVGNIDSNPLFADGAGGDLSLLEDSPCIDAAHGDYAPETDIKGQERVDIEQTANTGAGTPDYADMGAFEFQSIE